MKISCSRCGGNRTRRHDFRTYRQISLQGVESRGYQRWFCVDCKKPFIPIELKRNDVSPYDAEVREQSTILYIDTGGSYRAVMRQLRQWGLAHVQTHQVWQWIQEMGQKCADPFAVSQRLRPEWSGWLQVDGDRIPVEGMDVSIIAAQHRRAENRADLETPRSQAAQPSPDYALALRQAVASWSTGVTPVADTVGRDGDHLMGPPAVQDVPRRLTSMRIRLTSPASLLLVGGVVIAIVVPLLNSSQVGLASIVLLSVAALYFAQPPESPSEKKLRDHLRTLIGTPALARIISSDLTHNPYLPKEVRSVTEHSRVAFLLSA